MKNAHHESLWGLDYGERSPYDSFTPQEHVLIDFRLNLPETDPASLGMQYGLEGLQQDMVFSPDGEKKARIYEEERIEAIKLELKTYIRI